MTTVLELFSLQGRTALITGATRGIGQSLALALAEAGADILLVQRDDSNTNTKQQIEKLGRKATIYVADLAVRDQLRGIVRQILADGHDIDTLVNCGEHPRLALRGVAGWTLLIIALARSGGIQRRHPAHEFPDEDWDEASPTQYAFDLQRTDERSGTASQSDCGLHPVSRRRSIHAHSRAARQSATSRVHHQHCFPCELPRWSQRAGIRKCERRRNPVDEVAIQPVGKPGHQCQRGEPSRM